MIVTCPACGRTASVEETAREVDCTCGRVFDPAVRATVADPFLGRDVDGYRVDQVIGSGGMGTVYKATQLSLGRPVALKVLPTNVADDPQFVERFHREAEISGSLSHPNLVQVIDRGRTDGRYYIVMEYVDGTSLRELMRRGPMPQKEACRIVTALLEALDYTHGRGIVHRDVKPENVLVSNEGVVKVADFGLSRVLGGTERDTRLTRTHLVLGTYEYMAPEQREATRDADSRSDIFATAVILYEMLTGELPIGRFELPSSRVPGVDRRIDRVVARGLAKDPADRYDRASEMGRAVQTLLTTPDAPVDIEKLRQAGRKVASSVKDIFRRSPEAPQVPTSFEMHLDLLLTILAVLGMLLSVTGFGMIVVEHELQLGLVDIDGDYAGLLVLVYGILLWNAAERARKYWPGARTMLLALTAMAAPTLVALPVTVWTWVVLLGRRMRIYTDARFRGLEAAEAAALAQGMLLPPRQHPDALERRREAALLNRQVATWLGAFALAGWIATAIAVTDIGFRRAEGAVLPVISLGLSFLALLFARLSVRVSRGESMALNACVWTLLAPLATRAGRRARMCVRDNKDSMPGSGDAR